MTVAEFIKSPEFPFKELYKIPVVEENYPVINELARYIRSLDCKGRGHTKDRSCRFCPSSK